MILICSLQSNHACAGPSSVRQPSPKARWNDDRLGLGISALFLVQKFLTGHMRHLCNMSSFACVSSCEVPGREECEQFGCLPCELLISSRDVIVWKTREMKPQLNPKFSSGPDLAPSILEKTNSSPLHPEGLPSHSGRPVKQSESGNDLRRVFFPFPLQAIVQSSEEWSFLSITAEFTNSQESEPSVIIQTLLSMLC